MKNSKGTTLKNCEIVFDEDKIKIVESTKEEDKEFDLVEDVLEQYRGIKGLSISIKFDTEI